MDGYSMDGCSCACQVLRARNTLHLFVRQQWFMWLLAGGATPSCQLCMGLCSALAVHGDQPHLVRQWAQAPSRMRRYGMVCLD